MSYRNNPVDRRRLLFGAAAITAAAYAPAMAADVWTNSPFRRLSDAQWKARLPGEAYIVLRQEGTETAFTSPLLNEHRAGDLLPASAAVCLYLSRNGSMTPEPAGRASIPPSRDRW